MPGGGQTAKLTWFFIFVLLMVGDVGAPATWQEAVESKMKRAREALLGEQRRKGEWL
jgi:hypothetical protein